jgi:hypothetical protein
MVPGAAGDAEHIEVQVINRLGRPLCGVLTLSAAGTLAPIATFGAAFMSGQTTACLWHSGGDGPTAPWARMIESAGGLTVTLRVDDAGQSHEEQCLVRPAMPRKAGRRENVIWRSADNSDGRSSSRRLALSVGLA